MGSQAGSDPSPLALSPEGAAYFNPGQHPGDRRPETGRGYENGVGVTLADALPPVNGEQYTVNSNRYCNITGWF